MQYRLCCAAMIVHYLAVCFMCNSWKVVVAGPAWLDINSRVIVMPSLLLHVLTFTLGSL